MGKATIINNLGNGLYEVDYHYDTTRIDARLIELGRKIGALAATISKHQTNKNAAQIVYNSRLGDLNAAIMSGDSELISIATKRLTEQGAEVGRHSRLLASAKLDKHAAEKEKDNLEASTFSTKRMTVWCADFSDALTGDVGTIEIDGDPEKGVLIFPNGCAEIYTEYNPTLHGLCHSAINLTPANCYLNRALYPAWQKFKPSYRLGTITALSGNLCDISLTPTTSREQNLEINQTATFENVEIDYMCCDSNVFAVNDEVIVQLANNDWSQPKVIGFKDNPILCEMQLVASHDGVAKNIRYINGTWRSSPYTPPANSSNFGTNWRGRYVNGKPTLTVAWVGHSARYFHFKVSETISTPTRGPYLSMGGALYAEAPANVLGAAIQDVEGTDFLYVICQDWTVHRIEADSPNLQNPASWTLVGTIPIPDRPEWDVDSINRNSFFFNGDGTKAVTTQWGNYYNFSDGNGRRLKQPIGYRVTIVDMSISLYQFPIETYGGSENAWSGTCTFARDYIDDTLVEATCGASFSKPAGGTASISMTVNVAGTSDFTHGWQVGNDWYTNHVMFMDLRYGAVLRLNMGNNRPTKLILQAGSQTIVEQDYSGWGSNSIGSWQIWGAASSGWSGPMNGGILLFDDPTFGDPIYSKTDGATTKTGGACCLFEFDPFYHEFDYSVSVIMSNSNQDFEALTGLSLASDQVTFVRAVE